MGRDPFLHQGTGGTVDGVDFGSSIAGQLALRVDGFLPAVARANDRSLTATVNVGKAVDSTVIAMQIQELVIVASGRSESSAAVTAIWHSAVRKPLQELAKSKVSLVPSFWWMRSTRRRRFRGRTSCRCCAIRTTCRPGFASS